MLQANNISKQYGSKILYKNGQFTIRPNDKIGLVGPNGAGKTTIFRILTGEEKPDSGNVSYPDKLVIGYFSQDVADMSGRSALDEVRFGSGALSSLAERLGILEKQLEDTAINPIDDDAMAQLLEDYGSAQLEFEQRDGYNLEIRAKEVLTGLGVDYHRPVESFSGGWKMRIALAKILVLNPDVLLMDEPTNHLDVESIIWLEAWLKQFKGALLMTCHDREFMNNLVSRIIEVAHQNITTYSGNYDFYEQESAIRLTQLIASHKKQQDMLAKEEEFIARFAARASHAAQVQSRVKKLEKIDRIEIPTEEKTVDFSFPQAPRSGNDVIRIENAEKIYPAILATEKPKTVFSNVNAVVKRLDRIAVVGVNGAGKSTLLKCIVDQTPLTNGSIQLGAQVRVGYFSQNALDVLNPQRTIFEEIQETFPEATVGYIRNLLGAFLFSGDSVEKKISVLSGGEKSRVVLAKILATPVNLLVLDEPTNHLDITTRMLLLDAIKNFDGTVVIVSHDRHFLRSIVTRVFHLDHGHCAIYEGNYDYYLQASGLLH